MAKKKIKKISVNAMDEIMKNLGEQTETVEWNGVEVVITKTLSLKDMMSFADGVAKSCFSQETGAYMPEIKDFAIRSNVMTMYANFTLPSRVEAQYDVVMCSGAVEMIVNHINAAQFNELMRAIDAKIQNTAEVNVQAMYNHFNDVLSSFDDLQNKMMTMFDGVEPTDITKLLSAISDKGLSEDKVVQAYIEQTRQPAQEQAES